MDYGDQPGGVAAGQPCRQPGAGRVSVGDRFRCERPDGYGSIGSYSFPGAGVGRKNGTVTNSERRISRQRSFCRRRASQSRLVDNRSHGRTARLWRGLCPAPSARDFSEHAALSGFENNGQRAFDIGGLADLSREAWDKLAPVRWPVSRAAPVSIYSRAGTAMANCAWCR